MYEASLVSRALLNLIPENVLRVVCDRLVCFLGNNEDVYPTTDYQS